MLDPYRLTGKLVIVLVTWLAVGILAFAAFGLDKFYENGWTFAYHDCVVNKP